MATYLSPGIYVEEVAGGAYPIEAVGTSVAAFIGITEHGPVNTPTLVQDWGSYVRTFGEFSEGWYLAHAVYGFFLNGGGACYVVRLGVEGSAEGPSALVGGYRVTARPALGRDAEAIAIDVAAHEGGADRYTVVVKHRGDPVETFQVTTTRGRSNIATVLREQSRYVTVEEISARAGLATGTVALGGGGALVSVDDYVGDVAERTGLGGLEAVAEVTMVAAPDLMTAYQRGLIDLEGVRAVQLSMIAHCEQSGDRMAILDPPPGLSAQQVREWRSDHAGYDSRFAALYYPWLQVFDPAGGGMQWVPPSGHVAGVWARSDAGRGVHKAPANEVVRGALSLETQLTPGERELLNPIGVNCILAFPGRGIRVWGARTLSSDPEWRYLNVRRLFNYLERSIMTGTQWAVFEPNDAALWARIRRVVSAFLVEQWRRGALFGLTPDEAFYVKCDAETNPSESVDAGQVVCEIGVAPVKPAEFVVFRLAQTSGGAGLIGE